MVLALRCKPTRDSSGIWVEDDLKNAFPKSMIKRFTIPSLWTMVHLRYGTSGDYRSCKSYNQFLQYKPLMAISFRLFITVNSRRLISCVQWLKRNRFQKVPATPICLLIFWLNKRVQIGMRKLKKQLIA